MNVDLIIPTYNRALLLEQCLESVCRAIRPDNLHLTLIVVDNNSSDNTKSVVQAFIERNTISIKYIFVERPGKSAALNEALKQTSSELVGLIDDDEQLNSLWFNVIYREFSEAPKLGYIGGPCYPNWEQVPPDWLPSAYPGAIGIVLRPERTPFSREFKGMLMGGNAVIRRSALQSVLPYPEDLGKIGGKIRSGEDEVIYNRLLDLDAVGLVIPDLIIYHWIPANRLTKKYYRSWVVGRGISVGSQIRDRGFNEPGLLGIPRYKFGEAVRGIVTIFTAASEKERFTAQLTVLDCLATLYGRHFY